MWPCVALAVQIKIEINSIAKMLKNRRYIGEYSFRDVVVPHSIPAIVPENLFERVQEKIEKNKKAPRPS